MLVLLLCLVLQLFLLVLKVILKCFHLVYF
nr:MAG TPA: hypothetical protein [Caudoviricetes sp.]